MDFALFNLEGFLFLLRWLHIFFGILWIGLLYYFNFVQGMFFAETDATTKSNAIQKLVPRALVWFRWSAMFTLLTGLTSLMIQGHRDGLAIFATSWGVTILTGFAFGFLMWFNVWFVIWPNQRTLIESTLKVAQGGQANPAAAAAGARAGVASRTNTLFSVPMLFFMVAARHLPIQVNPEGKLGLYAGIMTALVAGLEFNALKGKTGPLTTRAGVLTSGFVLCFAVYFLLELLSK